MLLPDTLPLHALLPDMLPLRALLPNTLPGHEAAAKQQSTQSRLV